MTVTAQNEQEKNLLASFRGLREELMVLTGTPKHKIHALLAGERKVGEFGPVQWVQAAHFMLEDLHQAADDMANEADFRADCGF